MARSESQVWHGFSGRRTSTGKDVPCSLFDKINLWFTKGSIPAASRRGFKNNRIVLSEAFADDLELHLPPIDLNAIAAWSDKLTVPIPTCGLDGAAIPREAASKFRLWDRAT